MPQPLRILFPVVAEDTEFNAQVRTAQEIARRFDPARICSTFFYQHRAEPRLHGLPHVTLRRLPARLGSLAMLRQMLWGPYDVIFYLTPKPAERWYWPLRVFGRARRLVSTVEVSGDQIAALPDGLRRRVLRNLERQDLVVPISGAVRDSVRRSFGLVLAQEPIPLGVDPEVFWPVERSAHRPPWKVLFVGSFQPRKRPHLLLDMARRLAGRPFEIHLVGGTLGDPTYRDRLAAEAERDGLGNVFFHSPEPPERLARRMAECDVFVLPSQLEGMPKVTLEAAATGLPCIVFDAYQTPSVADGVNGYQVTDEEGLEERLRQLLDDSPLRLRMGRAAVEHVRPYHWSAIAERWQEVLLGLFEGK